MLTIQSVMLVLLGFLLATLLVLLLVPAYWRRAERLTSERIRASMPLTESEIRADKDRIRAEYAIKLHRLEVDSDKQAHASARQQIELNRRDATISSLEGEIAAMRTALEGYENAHRVLEQTIMERVPSLEQRLSEARKLAFQRDRELSELRHALDEQGRELEQTTLERTQQRDELFKVNSMLATYAARSRESLNDPGIAAEVALRAEIEQLKARLGDSAKELAAARRAAARPAAEPSRVVNGAEAAIDPAEVAELRAALADAEAALQAARSGPEPVSATRAGIETQLREIRAVAEDRAAEVARLSAALETYESGEQSMSMKDTRIGMKARLGALEAEREAQVATIQRMRGELASANERLARQAQHYMSEMRRLGANGKASAGSVIATTGAEPASSPASPEPAPAAGRPAIAERISEQAAAVARTAEKALDSGPALLKRMAQQELPRMRGLLKSLGGAAGREAASGDRLRERMDRIAPLENEAVAVEATEERPRARLVERLSNATKS